MNPEYWKWESDTLRVNWLSLDIDLTLISLPQHLIVIISACNWNRKIAINRSSYQIILNIFISCGVIISVENHFFQQNVYIFILIIFLLSSGCERFSQHFEISNSKKFRSDSQVGKVNIRAKQDRAKKKIM